MRLLSGMLFFLLILTVSCKKEEIVEIPEYPTFLPLEVGNYWIYERVRIESDGTETVEGIDSCFIKRETLKNGRVYYEYARPALGGHLITLLRDSLHYIVQGNGTPVFSSEDFDVPMGSYKKENKSYDARMIPGIKEVTVPAGTFNCYQYKETYNDTFPEISRVEYINYDRYFSENIGIIKENAFKFLYEDDDVERRLVRYYVGE